MFFVFCIFIIPLVVLTILLVSNRQRNNTETPPTDINKECAICYEEYPLTELITKEIGDYGKEYVFCGYCIETLYQEYQNKITLDSGE